MFYANGGKKVASGLAPQVGYTLATINWVFVVAHPLSLLVYPQGKLVHRKFADFFLAKVISGVSQRQTT